MKQVLIMMLMWVGVSLFSPVNAQEACTEFARLYTCAYDLGAKQKQNKLSNRQIAQNCGCPTKGTLVNACNSGMRHGARGLTRQQPVCQ